MNDSFDNFKFIPQHSPPPLTKGTIHVWRVISPLHHDTRRLAASALNDLSMAYTGNAHSPHLVRDSYGKPSLPDFPELHFNISHSGHLSLLAIAQQPLGIDVEDAEASIKRPVCKIARRFFHSDEADALTHLSVEQKHAAFLRLWTCKEAVLKALGRGLAFGLNRVRFELDADGHPKQPMRVIEDEGIGTHWQVLTFEPMVGYVGALAWQGLPCQILTFDYPS